MILPVRLYCARRLRRIRKALHFTQGHRNRYHKKPLTASTVKDVRYLHIPLINAERAWALAMELKQVIHTLCNFIFCFDCHEDNVAFYTLFEFYDFLFLL